MGRTVGICVHCGPLHGLQGNPCSSSCSTSIPSFFFDLAVHSGIPHIFFSSLLSLSHWYVVVLPFLNYVFPEVPLVLPVGLSHCPRWVCWSCLEVAVSGMGQPCFLTETTPAASTWPLTPSSYPLTKLQRHFVLKETFLR